MIDQKALKRAQSYKPQLLKQMHSRESRDITILIVLATTIVHYSSLFQYIFYQPTVYMECQVHATTTTKYVSCTASLPLLGALMLG